jgi:hypothetical protein
MPPAGQSDRRPFWALPAIHRPSADQSGRTFPWRGSVVIWRSPLPKFAARTEMG